MIGLIIFLFFGYFILGEVEDCKRKEYRNILIELGSIHVTQINSRYWKNKTTPEINFKGKRYDVNGWISPYTLKNSFFENILTGQQKLIIKHIYKANLIEWFKKYEDFLNVSYYCPIDKKSMKYTIISFLLEIIYNENLKVERKKGLINLCKMRIDFEKQINLILGTLTYPEAMEIYQVNKNAYTLKFFPVPLVNELEYRKYLESQVENINIDIFNRWYFYQLLYKSDNKKYRTKFIEFTINNVQTVSNWFYRSKIYISLIELNDDSVFKALSRFLIDDPVTECRELIMDKLMEKDIINDDIAHSVYLMILGKCRQHSHNLVGQDPSEWIMNLLKFVIFLNKNKDKFEKKSRKEIQRIFQIVTKKTKGRNLGDQKLISIGCYFNTKLK